MEVKEAKQILQTVASHRDQWGKHSGWAEYSDQDVLDALLYIHKEGFLDISLEDRDLKSQLTAANRAKGAAEARSTKDKRRLDHANEQIEALVIALEESEA